MTTPTNGPSTSPAASSAPSEASPSQAAPEGQAGGAEGAPGAGAPPPPGPARRTPKELAGAVQRMSAQRQREADLAKQAAELEPTRKIQALIQQGKHSEAFRAMAGEEGYLAAYQVLTEQVLGTQGEEKALEALPKSVRAKLAELDALKAQAGLVPGLQDRLAGLEKTQADARAQLAAQQREAHAGQLFTAGMEAARADSGLDLKLVTAHPNGEQLVQARWVELIREAPADKRKDPGLIKQAAQDVQSKLQTELEWVFRLQGEDGRGTMNGNDSSRGSTGSHPAPKSPATRTPGPKTPPRTVTPSGLGEPPAVDWSKLSKQERLQRLREEERSGTLVTRSR